MSIKAKEPEIIPGDPFLNCKLERKQYAEILTTIVASYADGFVLAINNEWGTGKTTFVKMWQAFLNNKEFKTLYFNAWENDFDDDPLVAIMAQLKSVNPYSEHDKFKSLVKKGVVLTKSAIPALVKGLAKKYIDSESIDDALSKMSGAAAKILEDEIDDYLGKKQGLLDFKNELTTFISENNKDKPLVFIIDELDRCRPDYAVKFLEHIKHFFSVPGIVFVLSIDKTQLSHAVQGFYGSDRINADDYLRRFIDIEYSLPEPSTKNFCPYLFEYFQFDDFFGQEFRAKHPELKGDKNSFIGFCIILFQKEHITLRQQERIFSHARIVIRSFPGNNYIFPQLLVFLIYLRFFKPEFYKIIRNQELAPASMLPELKKQFPKNIDSGNLRTFEALEALFLSFYFNGYREFDYSTKIWEKNPSGQETLMVSSAISPVGSDTLQTLVKNIEREYSGIKLDYLLKKIDLIENIR